MAISGSNGKPRIPLQVYTDLGMAIIYIGLSVFVMTTKKFGNFEFSGWGAWAFIGLLMIYGVFRGYRGYIAYQRSKEE